MRPVLAGAFALAFLFLSVLAAASENDDHLAGIVVRHGDGSMTYGVVQFEEESISGIELLRESGISLVTVEFGGLGAAVCSIEGEGCGVDACRTRVCQTADPDSPFWQYFQLDEEGEWVASRLGASNSRVADRGVDGWSWTSSEPGLPNLSIEDIADRAEYDVELDERSFVQAYGPDGEVVEQSRDRQSWMVYAGAVAVVLLIAAFAIGRGALTRSEGGAR